MPLPLPIEPRTLAIVGAAMAAFGLLTLFTGLVLWPFLGRGKTITRVPLLGRREIELASGGDYVIDMERPIYRWRRPRLLGIVLGPAVTLHDAATGEEIALRGPIFDYRTKGLTRERKRLKTFRVARAGRYVLVGDQGASPDDFSEHEMVVSRSGGVKATLLVLAMAAGGVLAAAGVVVAVLAQGPELTGRLR